MNTKEKLVPELRFPEFTDEWEEKKLGEEFNKVASGKTKTNSELGNYPLYGSTGKIESISNYDYTGEKILVARVGENTGLVNLVDGKYGVTDNTLILDDYNNLNINYYYYYLDNYDFRRIIIGSGQPLITGRDVKKLSIKTPSLPEQQKIGNFFNKIDKKLELQRKRIEELKTYKKGMMQRIFNQEIRFKDENGNEYPEWEEKKFSELGTFYNGLRGKNKDSFTSGNCRYIQYLNIFDNPLIDNNFNGYGYVRVDKGEEQNEVNYGDVLFTQSSEIFEEVGISSVYLDNKHTFLNSFSFGFRFKDDVNIDFKYIGYLLRSNKIRKRIIREGQGSTRFNLSSNRLKNISIPICSLDEQKKIGSFFYKLDKKIELEEEKLKEYEKYKKGLMQRMFI